MSRQQIMCAALWLQVAALGVDAQQVKTFAGGFTNGHYRFNRPQDFTTAYSGQFTIFHVYQFTNPVTQAFSASATGSGFTPWLFVYDFSFNPQNQVGGLYGVGQGSVSVPSLPGSAFVPYFLVVAGNTASDVGNYSGSMVGNVGIVTTFHDTLSLYSSPIGNTVNSGSPYTMYAYCHGRLPHKFQWYIEPRPANNTIPPDPALAIPGATNFSYTIPSVTVTTGYWCNISANGLTTTNRRTGVVTNTVVVGPATFSGSLTGQHDTWDRMTLLNVASGQTCFFETVTFQVVTPGIYTAQVNTVGFPAALNSYLNPFDSMRPGFNFYADGVTAGAAGQLQYATYYTPGTYDLIISSVSAFQTGTFTGFIAGAATPLIIPGPTNPSIWSQSAGATILTGRSATLQFSVRGAIPRRYQWLSGHEGYITVATNKIYTTPVFPTPGDRWYWATVSNAYGMTTTAQMRVRVVTNTPVYAGNLRPGNRQWHRSNGAGGLVTNWSYYKVYAFEVQQAGTYTSRFSVSGGIDALELYSAVFDPNNANLSRYDYVVGGSPLTLVTPNLPAGNYNLVLSSTASLATGTFSGSVSGPAFIRELGTPVISTPPAPLAQTNWPLETLLAITNSVPEPIISYEWYPGLAPGIPADGQAALPGATNFVFLPAPTSSSRWYFVRAYNSYGYDDGPLASTLVRPKPSFVVSPIPTNFNYAMPATNFAIVGDIPFTLYWQTLTGSTIIAALTNVIQGVSTNYTNAIVTSVFLSNYNAGVYGLRIVATNPSGVATSPAATLTVARRPLTVALPGATNVFNGLTQALNAAASDPIPGPVLPAPMPFAYQYTNGLVAFTNGAYDAGSWTTRVAITHSNYAGSATSLLVITRRPLTVGVANTTNQHDGTPKTNAVSFSDPAPGPLLPSPMPQSRVYADGLHTLTNPPYNTGVWTVTVTVAHSNFQGSGVGLLTIARSNLHHLVGGLTSSNLAMEFPAQWGRPVHLQSSPSLYGTWSNLLTDLTADSNELITIQVPLGTGSSQRFLRVVAP